MWCRFVGTGAWFDICWKKCLRLWDRRKDIQSEVVVRDRPNHRSASIHHRNAIRETCRPDCEVQRPGACFRQDCHSSGHPVHSTCDGLCVPKRVDPSVNISFKYPQYLAASYFAAVAAAFFWAAQRRLTASAMRLRPSGDRFLFLFLAGSAEAETTSATLFLGRPGFFLVVGVLAPVSNARAFCSCAMSLSMLARMSEGAMVNPLIVQVISLCLWLSADSDRAHFLMQLRYSPA
jgi:hypothetical protein